MGKKFRVLMVSCILLVSIGCGNKHIDVTDSSNYISEETKETDREIMTVAETDAMTKGEEEIPVPEKAISYVDTSDLKFSEGFKFESNGDGTCTITGIGVCTDKDIVIPEKSPAGDIVTLIDKYAFMSIEDVDSITLVNYIYKVDKYAFQYGEFTTLKIIGGSPTIGESAFSSCEDLTSVLFSDCDIQIDKYAFFSCGKKADVSFSNCTGFIDKHAFEYSDFMNLSMQNCEFEIEESAFSSCEDLVTVIFENCIIEAGEYAFFSCGDSADVEMNNCTVSLDDYCFQYGSYDSLIINGSKIEIGKSAFSSCEDLSTVTIDGILVDLDEYAFFDCEDLTYVSLCDNMKSENNIIIDDYAFQYCKRLKTVKIGSGKIEIGEYVFSGCDDDLDISIAGKNYKADLLEDGLSQ